MLIRNANAERTAAAMKRGEWPEPDAEVVKAFEAIQNADKVPLPMPEVEETDE